MRIIEEIARNMAAIDGKALFWEQYEGHVRRTLEFLKQGLVEGDQSGKPAIDALDFVLNEKNS